jgi:NAD(P)-dependent dehydrogenase (short-subunit alcohol dehydrogenase family)
MPTKTEWTSRDVPEQSGRSFIVTGANSGIGLETARVLAQGGAEVTLACRNQTKAAAARDDILGTAPDANLHIGELDLASLASVRSFAADYLASDRPLHVLVNNAGIMGIERTLTEDGFEAQLAVNHLGHFALTGLLIDRLLENPDPRVVNVSSLAHRSGRIDFDDLMLEGKYRRFGAYGQSKLANLLFTMELQRRFRWVDRRDALAVACHPGLSATNLAAAIDDGLWGRAVQLTERFAPNLGQSPLDGSVPTLRAATDPDVAGGDYFGPSSMGEIKGPAVKVKARPKAYDVHDARGLWEASVKLTGVTYDALVPQHD